MPSENIYTYILIDEQSVTPKYLQLTNSILKSIESGKIEHNYVLPSINDLSYELDISRDTVEKAYKRLKKIGVIGSVPGKGYFINKKEFKQPLKIFLLFNKLSTHKKIMYDAFAAALGEKAAIDFYIYNNDFLLFKKLLTNKKDAYDYYVIIPHFLEGGDTAYEFINTIPKEKLVLLDKLLANVDGDYAAVYENFEKDIYHALEKALPQLSKYHTLKIIFPSNTYHPVEIIKGFEKFCDQYAFDHVIVSNIAQEKIADGIVYISLMEDDLVLLIKKIKEAEKNVGVDVGVISYNEIPLKEIILNGITTISTDFKKMGEETAKMILNKSRNHIEVPFTLNLRSSL